MNEVVSMDVSRVGKILGRIFSAAVTAYAVWFQLKLLLPYAQFGLTSGCYSKALFSWWKVVDFGNVAYFVVTWKIHLVLIS